ncbi:hypothetical protein O6H91_05G059300 [Diphasiastrum complanatum]|uniref:Uncharacterized protein n=1 Tax=Diphasiastrum complanatum TaxID=34168 RepID=A0ACC2DNR1_DIPCM|nr:hypothetical protein O6H91_05G059300 [Diphasiastrum complanatum]
MTKEEYMKAISKAKEHILAGDIFQVVLSQRFERRTFADPFEVYRALRIVNPSPYMIYLQVNLDLIDVAKVSELPPRDQSEEDVYAFLHEEAMQSAGPRCDIGCIKPRNSDPNKGGTRRRGITLDEDNLLERELLMDQKECAEHVMLVDLGRNDVGKVSKAGTVTVDKFMEVERYSHVMHISSTVTGELLDELTGWDALRAALPVGTVSGAPKVRAMQLIDQLEPTRRGPYSGGIGAISFDGDMDIALALRTMVFPTFARYNTLYLHNGSSVRREWIVHLQTGAGIVADSNPDDEYKECVNKAAGLGRAIDLAEAAFTQRDVYKIPTNEVHKKM